MTLTINMAAVLGACALMLLAVVAFFLRYTHSSAIKAIENNTTGLATMNQTISMQNGRIGKIEDWRTNYVDPEIRSLRREKHDLREEMHESLLKLEMEIERKK